MCIMTCKWIKGKDDDKSNNDKDDKISDNSISKNEAVIVIKIILVLMGMIIKATLFRIIMKGK